MLHYGEGITAHWPQPLRNILSSGFIGVDLFFVLSGFILSWNYLSDDRRLTVSSADFWRARAARVLPLYYVSLALALPVFLLMQFQKGITSDAIRSAIVTAVTTLTLTQSWVSPFSFLWNNPGWSLSVEVFLYLAFPYLAMWFARNPVSKILKVAGGFYAVTAVGGLLFAALHSHPSAWKWDPVPDYCIWISWIGCNPVVHFHELLMGSAACIWLREEQTGNSPERIAGPRAVWIAISLVLALLIFKGRMPFMAALVGIYSPLFAMLIYGLAKQRGLVARVLSTRAFVFLGEISFALYLTHLVVWWNMEGFNLEHTYLKQDSMANFLVCVTISLALATLLYKGIEVPYRRTLRKKWQPSKVAIPVLQTASSSPSPS